MGIRDAPAPGLFSPVEAGVGCWAMALLLQESQARVSSSRAVRMFDPGTENLT